jgi:integral membrane sensor domain MASE1
MTVPIWAWIATLAVFAVLIAADLFLTRDAGTGPRVAALMSGLWVGAGAAFGGVLWPGLAVLLAFIGVKMLISPVAHVPVTVSLIVIIVIVGCAVAASLWRDRALPRPANEPTRRPANEPTGPVAR